MCHEKENSRLMTDKGKTEESDLTLAMKAVFLLLMIVLLAVGTKWAFTQVLGLMGAAP